MKYILYLLALISLVACNQPGEKHNICYDYYPFVYQRDSIHIGDKNTSYFSEMGKPTFAILNTLTQYKEEYLLAFCDACQILSLSKENLKVDTFPVPEYFWGSELFVEHDSLKILSGGEHEKGGIFFYYQYYNEPTKTWVTLDTIPNPLRTFGVTYEDDDQKVLYSERGEYGNYLIFVDKSTGKEYLWCYPAFKLLKYHGYYYTIGYKTVCRINDPKTGISYDGRLHKYLSFDSLSDYKQAQDSLLYANYESEAIIESGFVVDDELYFVVNDSVETYIAKIDNGELQKVFGLGEKLHIVSDSHHRRGFNVSDSTVCIGANGNDYSYLFYVLDINGRKVRLIKVSY